MPGPHRRQRARLLHPIQVHPRGSVQLPREEPRALWGRATLLVGVCAPPELGQGGSLEILAVMSWPKLVEYVCVLPCARPQPGLGASALGGGLGRMEAYTFLVGKHPHRLRTAAGIGWGWDEYIFPWGFILPGKRLPGVDVFTEVCSVPV